MSGYGQFDTPPPGIVVTDPDALRAWLESNDHLYNCIGYNEGQTCCLGTLVEWPDRPAPEPPPPVETPWRCDGCGHVEVLVSDHYKPRGSYPEGWALTDGRLLCGDCQTGATP